MKKDLKIAVIGGSGVYKLEGLTIVTQHQIETPFGNPSAPIMEIEIKGSSFYFIPRHGTGHFISPSDVNYRANIFALKKLGVTTIVSVSAVGSLKEELPPTTFVIPDQFIDWTKGLRKRSFFEEGMVGHVSCALPIEISLQKRIAEVCQKVNVKYSTGGSYLCIEGPQFSTKAESAIYRSFGAAVIGMTNVPEAFLAKEAGMAYATIAMVTDYDCWKDEHCTLEEVMRVMHLNYGSAQKVLTELIPDLVKNPVKFEPENRNAVVTTSDKLSNHHKQILDVLLK